MMENTPGKCKDCRCVFIERTQLYCTRFPPTAFMIMQQNVIGGSATPQFISAYPPVMPDNGCFEFMPSVSN